MTQQINLYNSALRRRREWLSLSTVAALVLLFAVVLLAAGAGLRWQTQNLAGQAKALDAQLAGERSKLAQLAERAGAGAAIQDLAGLQKQLADRREVLVALRSGIGGADSTSRFADYLRGLARQSVGGLWLTGFAVAQGGEGMEIRGRMTDAGSLTQYIRRLNGEPGFKGRQFVSLRVDRGGDKSPAAGEAARAFNEFVLTAVVVADPAKDKAAK